ncbi:hypothetical protein LCGC14_2019920, partial [marine sediment metagenome]
MAANTTDTVIVDGGAVYYGTAGSAPTTPLGYIEVGSAVVVNVTTPDRSPLVVQGEAFPVAITQTKRMVTVEGVLRQFDNDNLNKALGLSGSSAEQILDSSLFTKIAPKFSFKLVVPNVLGSNWTFEALQASMTSDPSFSFND